MSRGSQNSLTGARVLVTRPAMQARALVEKISDIGAFAISVPLLEINSFRGVDCKSQRDEIAALIKQIDLFDDLIFVSVNAVREAYLWFAELGFSDQVKTKRVFAVGEATASSLAQQGINAHSSGSGMTSEALLAVSELQQVDGRNILIFKGVKGRPLLWETLNARGAKVRCCDLYQRFCPQQAGPQLRRVWQDGGMDVILISSGEILDSLVSLLQREVSASAVATTRLVVPSPRLREKAFGYGFENVTIAANATDNAMVDALRKQNAD